MHILRVLEKVHHLFLIFFKLSFFWNGELSPSPTKGRCLHGSHGVKVLQTLGQDLNSLTPTLGHSRFHFLLYRFLKIRKVLRETQPAFWSFHLVVYFWKVESVEMTWKDPFLFTASLQGALASGAHLYPVQHAHSSTWAVCDLR